MRIIIKAKNLELTEDLKTSVEEKIGSLKKFIDILKDDTPDGKNTLAEVFVEIEKETTHHNKGNIFLATVQVSLPGKSLRAEAREENPARAIVEVREELKKEVEKYKSKKTEKHRREQRKTKKGDIV